MTIATITNIEPMGSFESSQYGTMHKFYVTLDDGAEGMANSTKPTPPYGVGKKVAYEASKDKFGKPKLKVSTKLDSVMVPSRMYGDPVPNQTFPQSGAVNGQTVGMAIKESLSLMTQGLSHDEIVGMVLAPSFWDSIETVAGHIIASAKKLEGGSKPVSSPIAAPKPNTATVMKPSLRVPPNAEAYDSSGSQEDVPF
jgi:hypothetical protein